MSISCETKSSFYLLQWESLVLAMTTGHRGPQGASSSLQNLFYFLLVFPGENFCRVVNLNGIETQKKTFKFDYGKSLKLEIQYKD